MSLDFSVKNGVLTCQAQRARSARPHDACTASLAQKSAALNRPLSFWWLRTFSYNLTHHACNDMQMIRAIRVPWKLCPHCV